MAATDSRAQAVIEQASQQKAQLDAGKRRKWFRFRRRTKMRFRTRLLLLSGIFSALLLAYLLDFFAGGTLGAAMNDWTDGVMDSAIHAVCATAAHITGDDWSGRELALSRLLLLGPASYVILAFFASLIASGIIAIAWSLHATRHALDDGTSNFLPEPPTSQ